MNRDCSVETADEVRPPFPVPSPSAPPSRPALCAASAWADPLHSHFWRDVEQSEVPEKWRTASQSLSSLDYSSEQAAVVGPLSFPILLTLLSPRSKPTSSFPLIFDDTSRAARHPRRATTSKQTFVFPPTNRPTKARTSTSLSTLNGSQATRASRPQESGRPSTGRTALGWVNRLGLRAGAARVRGGC